MRGLKLAGQAVYAKWKWLLLAMAHWRSAWRHLARLPEVWRCAKTFRHAPQLIREYLQLSAPELPRELSLRDGKRLAVETYEDLATAWVIFCRREYRVPRDARTIMDVGANRGMFSVHAASRCPAARIAAVEPFPPTFERLMATIADNNLSDRVALLPIGVAAGGGKRVIPDAPLAARQSLGISPAGIPSSGTEIPVASLGDLIASACELLGATVIDFLKMDVEGAEHEALHAASAEAMQRVQMIALEYHPNGDKAALFERLRLLGFELADDRPIGVAAGVAHWRRAGAGAMS